MKWGENQKTPLLIKTKKRQNDVVFEAQIQQKKQKDGEVLPSFVKLSCNIPLYPDIKSQKLVANRGRFIARIGESLTLFLRAAPLGRFLKLLVGSYIEIYRRLDSLLQRLAHRLRHGAGFSVKLKNM